MRAIATNSAPLIDLRAVRREFPSGDGAVVALDDVTLQIEAGEMVAIIGMSGSGKSTLMNILGCLDRPTSGDYRLSGRSTGDMGPDELSALRREHFGFIFQRYHLLGDLSALSNVEVPAVYLGRRAQERRELAEALLTRLGLEERMEHLPNQLSGGQQQRVSIARALINGGAIILADEPTGALDTQTGEEVMRILRELNDDGHTIIIVTHERDVAAHADRIIELRDGVIVSDTSTPRPQGRSVSSPLDEPASVHGAIHGWVDRFGQALRMAGVAMYAHKLRTFLTMLGIIIGVASVVSVVALGEGSRRQVLENISGLGTNRIDIYPGSGFSDRRANAVRTLLPSDAEAIAAQSYVDSATPTVSSQVTLRAGGVSASASVTGAGDAFFRVRGMTVLRGSLFTEGDIDDIAQVVVIDETARDTMFPDGSDPIGQTLLVGAMPARVIGVVEASGFGFRNDQLNVYAPYTSVMVRLLGQTYLSGVTVRVADDVSMAAAEQALSRLLAARHGQEDFYLNNTDDIRETIEATTGTMRVLIASIAVISLIVGGIGVMNIMLVSVTERIREIGVRMAVGARRGDIMQQFLIEAVLVCLIGGGVGVALAFAVGGVFEAANSTFSLAYSLNSVVMALTCAAIIGVGFGFLPARNASRLDPVEALSRE